MQESGSNFYSVLHRGATAVWEKSVVRVHPFRVSQSQLSNSQQRNNNLKVDSKMIYVKFQRYT